MDEAIRREGRRRRRRRTAGRWGALTVLCSRAHHVRGFQLPRPSQPGFKRPADGFRPSDAPRMQLHAPTILQSTSLQAVPPVNEILDNLPFEDISRQLSDALDIGADFLFDSESLSAGRRFPSIPEAETSIVLESVGQDLLLFLELLV